MASEEDFFPKIAGAVAAAAARRGRLGRPEPGLSRRRAVLPARDVDRAGRRRAGVHRRRRGEHHASSRRSPRSGSWASTSACSATGSASSTRTTTSSRKDALVNVNNAPSLGTSPNRFINVGRVRNWGDEVLLRARAPRRAARQARHHGQRLVHEEQPRGPRRRTRTERRSPSSPAASTRRRSSAAGLPLGAYYDERRLVQRRERRRADRLPAAARARPSCEFTVSRQRRSSSARPSRRRSSPSRRRCRSGCARLTATLDRRTRPEALQPHRRVPQRDLRQRRGRCSSPTRATSQEQAAAQAAATGTSAASSRTRRSRSCARSRSSLTLPQRFAARAGAASAVLTLAGRNLHTWTKYSGLDPEVNAGGAVELQHGRLPDRAAGPLLHRASRAELLRERHS